MTDPILGTLERHRSRGVLVDTNILLLYFVGRFAPRMISQFKRTRAFDVQDYHLLARLLTGFRRIVTTPNVLSEVNGLSAQIREPLRTKYFGQFAREITALDEHYVPSAEAACVEHFTKLGLTDAAILALARSNYLVLTDDVTLYLLLESAGIDVLNFNHLRPLGWS
jgi:rRNA-processing protein FCF1